MPWLWVLTLVLLILGMAQSTVDVGGNTLLVWVYRSEVSPFMNGLHFFFGVGAFLSPIIVGQAISLSDDISWAYWLLALLIAPVAIWLLRLPSPSAPADSEGNPEERGNREAGMNGSQARPRRSKRQRGILIALIALFFFLFVGAEISFGGWIYSYAVALNLATETNAAYLTSAFWGSLTVARLLSIPFAARFRPRTILFVDLVGCLASIALILVWPNSLVAIWLGTLGAGFSLAAIFPTAISLAERNLTVTGQVTSWFIVGASAGSMSLPWLIGQLFETVGPRVMMLAIFIDLVLAVGIFGVMITYATRSARQKLGTEGGV
jgi:fucose permease